MSGELTDLNRKSKEELNNWIREYSVYFGKSPSVEELENYVETLYHWQVMNTLIHDFGLQKYGGNYIFSYASWNYDKPVTQVYLESDFRRYLRLFWNGKIGVIPCRES